MKITNKNFLPLSLLWVLGSSGVLAAGAGTGTSLVTIMPHLILGNDNSYNPSLAAGGNAVAFESDAFNFLAQDANYARDIFLANGKKISRISINSNAEEARNCQNEWIMSNNLADSKNPAISPSGKFVVFESLADNLDLLTKDSDNNGSDPLAQVCSQNNSNGKESDIYLRDIAKKKTYRLSGIMDGADGVTLPVQNDVFGKALSTADQPWKITTEADDQSTNPAISANDKAQVVVFQSRATNLVSVAGGTGLSSSINCGNVKCNRWHIYALDLVTKRLELISATHGGLLDPKYPTSFVALAAGDDDSMSPSISPDGRFVSYSSYAGNLVSGVSGNANADVFIYDRNTGKTYQLSGALSANPAPVAPNTQGFTVNAEGDDDSRYPSIASGPVITSKKAKGAGSIMIAFQSRASNLDSISDGSGNNADEDVFVVEFASKDSAATNPATADYEIKSLRRISGARNASGDLVAEASKRTNSNSGAAVPADSTHPAIFGNKDAYVVAFRSDADNLYPPETYFWNEDSNQKADVYVWDSKLKLISRANVDGYGTQGSDNAVCASKACSDNGPAISPDGKTIGFDTADDYLVPYMIGNAKSQLYTHKYQPAKLANPNF